MGKKGAVLLNIEREEIKHITAARCGLWKMIPSARGRQEDVKGPRGKSSS